MKRRAVLVDNRGVIRVGELAPPEENPLDILITNRNSLISSGTELSVVKSRRKSPNDQAEDFPLGYSSAGVVESAGDSCKRVKTGDRVASQGWALSVHSNRNSVPEPLVAVIPDNVSFEEAAFTTLTTVAMNAVRRSRIGLGEWALVIGQGLIGQIVAQLARLCGGRTIVADLHDTRLALSRQTGVEMALNPDAVDLSESVDKNTDGRGANVVFVCTGGENTEVFRTATELAADRAKIVLVGRTDNLCTGDRVLYQKELSILIARGYGPGYHDRLYEKEGIDYPPGYVRWTENRNMAEALRLMSTRALDVQSLITHRFRQEEAPQAYETIEQHPESVMGVVLTY